MATYERVDGMWNEIGGFSGASVFQPEYRCRTCGEAIEKKWYDITGDCRRCHEGENDVGEAVEKIYTVSIYLGQDQGHALSEEIVEAKNGDHVTKMAEILAWGVRNFDDLERADILVPPPSGEGGDNHMVKIGNELSKQVGIPLRDVVSKRVDYPAQKHVDSAEERMENIRGKMESSEPLRDVNFAVVIDDIVTTCATISNTGRALIEAGVKTVIGLGIARDESLSNLHHVGALELVDDDE
jgi:predicted amidophosphoribosyltransferase